MRARFAPCSALLLSATAGLASAQTASYATFGAGCNGTGPGYCASNNLDAQKLQLLSQIANPWLAIEARAGLPVVRGFEIFSKANTAPATVTAHVFLATPSGTPQATPAASGTLTVGTTLGWYKATLNGPLPVPPGQPFFLSWDPGTARLRPFSDPVADVGIKSLHYERTSATTAWTGKPTRPWVFRVDCVGQVSPPWLAATGVPKLATTFSIELQQARPNTAALLITGSSKTSWGPFPLPLDLTGAGASGCSLLASFDLVAGVATNSFGIGQLKIAIPGSAVLSGITFHNQWLVIDPGVNALGIALSNGGSGVIGT